MHCQPEFTRMVGHSQMHHFVGDDVPQYGLRGHDKPPVEREIAQRRAVTPLGALAHHIEAIGHALQALADFRDVQPDAFMGLLAQPVFKRTVRRRFAVSRTRDGDRAILKRHPVWRAPVVATRHAHSNVITSKHNAAIGMFFRATGRQQFACAVQLLEHLIAVGGKEGCGLATSRGQRFPEIGGRSQHVAPAATFRYGVTMFPAFAKNGLLFFCERTALLAFLFGDRNVSFVLPLIAQPFVEHQRQDVVLVVLSGSLAAQDVSCAPKVSFELLLGKFHSRVYGDLSRYDKTSEPAT